MHDAPNTSTPNAFRSAAVYCRISSDKTGAGLGVDRQEADCRELAERIGFTVRYVFSDNDISAYSGKPRPGYQRLLELMKAGEIDGVVSWHQDRLHRSQVELEDYVAASEHSSIPTYTVKAGLIDLSTPAGRFQARIIGAAARYEVEHMIERQRAAKLQAAKDGKFLGGQRPFGFEPRRVAIREDEAALLRDMAQQVIAGHSFRTVAVSLNRQGITTQHGKEWNALKVRNVLIRPINAGIVRHHGIEHEAKTPAIFTPSEWEDLNHAIREHRVRSSHPGTFRKHLLSGYLHCGHCKSRMYHKTKIQRDGSKVSVAACTTNDTNTGMPSGCGKVSRRTDPIVDLITEAVMYRLDSPALAAELERQEGSNPTRSLAAQLRTLEARLTELNNDYYVTKLLDRTEFEELRTAAKSEIASLESTIDEARATTLLGGIDVGKDLRGKWDSETVEWQRDLLDQLVRTIYVHPRGATSGYTVPTYKQWKFDPNLIDIVWKV
ncbi:recombinase family protein [Tsukamurella spumae]|uniref:Recombinase family protein n=1 Tax=Tsukamurella spumae TaxID=44753 RepID=A0A846X4T5_9ACTN|nr:recombinase family protein [Tsukamurella spumae]NKY18850.1 recombinase family protein [Tsukamurella spumae]